MPPTNPNIKNFKESNGNCILLNRVGTWQNEKLRYQVMTGSTYPDIPDIASGVENEFGTCEPREESPIGITCETEEFRHAIDSPTAFSSCQDETAVLGSCENIEPLPECCHHLRYSERDETISEMVGLITYENCPIELCSRNAIAYIPTNELYPSVDYIPQIIDDEPHSPGMSPPPFSVDNIIEMGTWLRDGEQVTERATGTDPPRGLDLVERLAVRRGIRHLLPDGPEAIESQRVDKLNIWATIISEYTANTVEYTTAIPKISKSECRGYPENGLLPLETEYWKRFLPKLTAKCMDSNGTEFTYKEICEENGWTWDNDTQKCEINQVETDWCMDSTLYTSVREMYFMDPNEIREEAMRLGASSEEFNNMIETLISTASDSDRVRAGDNQDALIEIIWQRLSEDEAVDLIRGVIVASGGQNFRGWGVYGDDGFTSTDNISYSQLSSVSMASSPKCYLENYQYIPGRGEIRTRNELTYYDYLKGQCEDRGYTWDLTESDQSQCEFKRKDYSMNSADFVGACAEECEYTQECWGFTVESPKYEGQHHEQVTPNEVKCCLYNHEINPRDSFSGVDISGLNNSHCLGGLDTDCSSGYFSAEGAEDCTTTAGFPAEQITINEECRTAVDSIPGLTSHYTDGETRMAHRTYNAFLPNCIVGGNTAYGYFNAASNSTGTAGNKICKFSLDYERLVYDQDNDFYRFDRDKLATSNQDNRPISTIGEINRSEISESTLSSSVDISELDNSHCLSGDNTNCSSGYFVATNNNPCSYHVYGSKQIKDSGDCGVAVNTMIGEGRLNGPQWLGLGYLPTSLPYCIIDRTASLDGQGNITHAYFNRGENPNPQVSGEQRQVGDNGNRICTFDFTSQTYETIPESGTGDETATGLETESDDSETEGIAEKPLSLINNGKLLKQKEKVKFCIDSRDYLNEYNIDCEKPCCGGECNITSAHSTGYDANSVCFTNGDRPIHEDASGASGICRPWSPENTFYPGPIDARNHRYNLSEVSSSLGEKKRINLRFCDHYLGYRNNGEYDGGCSSEFLSTSAGILGTFTNAEGEACQSNDDCVSGECDYPNWAICDNDCCEINEAGERAPGQGPRHTDSDRCMFSECCGPGRVCFGSGMRVDSETSLLANGVSCSSNDQCISGDCDHPNWATCDNYCCTNSCYFSDCCSPRICM
jgi:hypothetical protein